MSRKRQYDEALGDGEKNDDAENEELKEHVSKMMMDGQDTTNLDPPARERPAVSFKCTRVYHLFITLHIPYVLNTTYSCAYEIIISG